MMSWKQSKKKSLKYEGFSLVELMIAMAVASIAFVLLAMTFERSGKLYTTQNVTSALQAEVRAAVEIMAREVRMAGYDPYKTGDFEIKTATSNHLLFTLDIDENGAVGTTGFPNCERLSFRFSAASQALQIICGENKAWQDIQTLIGSFSSMGTSGTKVTNLNFDYMDNQNNSTTFIPDIRGVVITLTAQAPAGRAGMIEKSYSTWVEFRNAAPNAAFN